MADSALAELHPDDISSIVKTPSEPIQTSGSMMDSLGRATQSAPEALPLIFRFTWQGFEFTTEVAQTEKGQESTLKLRAAVGTLPFTAENVIVRNRLIERLRRSQFNLGREIALTSGSDIELEMNTRLAPNAQPSDAIKTVSACLLLAKDDLEEIRSLLGTTAL